MSIKKLIKAIITNNHYLNSLVRKAKKIRKKLKRPISGKNNKIINYGFLSNVRFDVAGNNNLISIGVGAELSDLVIYIRGNNHVLKIANNCEYKSGSVWFEDHDCQIVIGRYTTIESAHLAVTEPNSKIIIGEDCMFSRDIEFRTGDSHTIIDLETKKRINPAQDIEVGNHVWIGARSIILKGARIGNNSIIGINAIVTSDVPDHSIAAGIPAKEIKNNIDWIRERVYT